MRPIRGQEMPGAIGRSRLQAQHIGKSHDASASIAAHHAAGTVRIEELHGEVIAIGQPQNHQAVGAVLCTKFLDTLPLATCLHAAFPAVKDHEVVSRSGE